MSFSKGDVEVVAHSYRARIQKLTKPNSEQKHAAWMETMREFSNTRNALSEDRTILHREVENYIREQERMHKEKAAKAEIKQDKTTPTIESQITETNKSNLTTLKGSLGIEKSQPPEPGDEEFLEPRTVIYHETPVEKLPEEQHEPEKIIIREIHVQDQDQNHEEMLHEPETHPKFLFDAESTKYVSREVAKESLRSEHDLELEKRTGLSKEAREKINKSTGPKIR